MLSNSVRPPINVNSGYGAYVHTSDHLFDSNEVYNNGGYGIHGYGTAAASRNTIQNNTIHWNGTQGGTTIGIGVGYTPGGNGNIATDNTIVGNCGGIEVRRDGNVVDSNTIHENAPG